MLFFFSKSSWALFHVWMYRNSLGSAPLLHPQPPPLGETRLCSCPWGSRGSHWHLSNLISGPWFLCVSSFSQSCPTKNSQGIQSISIHSVKWSLLSHLGKEERTHRPFPTPSIGLFHGCFIWKQMQDLVCRGMVHCPSCSWLHWSGLHLSRY